MLISIVIPTYKRPHYLPPLLKKLQSQAALYPNGTEIIIVDNCPDASAMDTVQNLSGNFTYLHEPVPGVANARNLGVRAARGEYILFIDDDELPVSGWLDAFQKQAKSGVVACFGAIEPRFLTVAPSDLSSLLEGLFSRRFPFEDGEDISRFRAYLGSGNSMFKKAICLPGAKPFDPRFNGGGEDVWLLRQLVVGRGLPLTWCATGQVIESVPTDRMTRAFVRQRKFQNGQLRCIVENGAGGSKAHLRVVFWMTAGVIQVLVHGSLALLFTPFDKTRATNATMHFYGGLGKILWWRTKPSKNE